MMHLADIADREEQSRRPLVDDLAAEMLLREQDQTAMEAEIRRIGREGREE